MGAYLRIRRKLTLPSIIISYANSSKLGPNCIHRLKLIIKFRCFIKYKIYKIKKYIFNY